MIEKIIFNFCRTLIRDIFSSESTFRNLIPQIFESFDNFISNLLTKEHIYIFTYFFAILCLTKKGQIKYKDFYVKQLKEKTCILEHTANEKDLKISSISSSIDLDSNYV